MMNVKLLSVVTPPYIYHSCSTWKTFWEEKFTGEENLFLPVNMRNCSSHNVKKHKEIKGSDKCVTLDISLKFDSLDKIKITSSESKGTLERSGKGLIPLCVSRPKQGHTNTKRQGMPSEMSVRRTFLRLLGSLRNLRNHFLRSRNPNMSLLTATFI